MSKKKKLVNYGTEIVSKQNVIKNDLEKNIIGKLASKADIESLIFLKNKNLSLDQIYSKKGEVISISRQF